MLVDTKNRRVVISTACRKGVNSSVSASGKMRFSMVARYLYNLEVRKKRMQQVNMCKKALGTKVQITSIHVCGWSVRVSVFSIRNVKPSMMTIEERRVLMATRMVRFVKA